MKKNFNIKKQLKKAIKKNKNNKININYISNEVYLCY